MEAPGRNVRQKAGLNRAILATGWGGLRTMLAYKAPRLIAVDPGPYQPDLRRMRPCGRRLAPAAGRVSNAWPAATRITRT